MEGYTHYIYLNKKNNKFQPSKEYYQSLLNDALEYYESANQDLPIIGLIIQNSLKGFYYNIDPDYSNWEKIKKNTLAEILIKDTLVKLDVYNDEKVIKLSYKYEKNKFSRVLSEID